MNIIRNKTFFKKLFVLFFVWIIIAQSFVEPINAETIVDRKWVTNQTSSYYNDGKYKGTLSKYLAGGSYDSKTVTEILEKYGHSSQYYVCRNGTWHLEDERATDRKAPIYYNSGGYTGYLYYQYHYSVEKIFYPSRPWYPCDDWDSYTWTNYNNVVFSGTVVKDTRYYRYEGWVYAAVSDPSGSEKENGSTSGRAKGNFDWKLEKANDSSPSRIKLTNTMDIDGNHYATRNKEYKINISGVASKTDNKPITLTINDPNDVKGKTAEYSFSYEYTNYYKDHYTCIDSRSDGCYEWKFSHRTPDWSYAETATFTETLPIDHNYGETVNIDDDVSDKFIIGRSGEMNGTTSTKEKQEETFDVDASSTSLLTQTWMPINEQITYNSDFGNKLYVIEGERWLFPNDIDENLREKYENETSFEYSDYAIPLRIGDQNKSSVTFNTSDNFFVTENTGFLFSLPHTEISEAIINDTAKAEYEDYTGQTYDDNVLTEPSEGSRYYLNIDGNGEQEPDTWYNHDFVLGKLGLNDLTFHLNEKIKFDRYLLGSPLDDSVITEQQESVISDVDYQHSVQISPEEIKEIKQLAKDRSPLLHSFRSTDIYEKYNQLKDILPSISY